MRWPRCLMKMSSRHPDGSARSCRLGSFLREPSVDVNEGIAEDGGNRSDDDDAEQAEGRARDNKQDHDGRIQIDGTLDLRYEEGVLELLDRDEEDDDRPDLAGVSREHDDDSYYA